MKTVLLLSGYVFCLVFVLGASLADAQDRSAQFQTAEKLFASGQHEKALGLIRELDQVKDLDDALRKDVRWALVSSLTTLSQSVRNQMDWAASKKYANELVKLIEKSETEFSGEFLAQLKTRKYWNYKNMVLSCTGLDELADADVYRKKLYEGYDQKSLPEWLDKSFNFDFVRMDGRNVWGYEYYPKLSDPEAEGSFSKIVYQIFRAKKDGTDAEALYRLHVVKVHKINDSDEDLYVLTLRWEVDGEEGGRSLFDHLYTVPIDVKKLRKDIRGFVKAHPKFNESESGKKTDKGK